MRINFLNTKTNKKDNIFNNFVLKINWREVFYTLSYLVIALFIFIIGVRAILSFKLIWLKKIIYPSSIWIKPYILPALDWLRETDIILFFFILPDLFIINRVLSRKGLKNERFWFWFLICLLFINFIWGFGAQNYSKLGIYEFHIALNYFIIALGLLFLKSVREKVSQWLEYLKKIGRDTKNEIDNESLNEERRKREFPNKFLKINKIPVLRNIIRWIYKEGWKYSLVLFIIFIVGMGLRVYNLDFLSPAGDEYRHLIAMKHYFADGYFEYSGSHITTYILIIIKKITNSDSLSLYRLSFALFGSFSIILFYMIVRKINKAAGLVAAYLFAFFPLAIGLARYIRGYEVILFIMLLFIYLSQKKFIKNVYLRLIVLALVLRLIIHFDADPRFKASFFIFTAFAGIYIVLGLINRIIKEKKLNGILKSLFMVLFFFFGLFLIPKLTAYNILPESEQRYLYLFNFYNSDTIWYFSFIPYILIVFIFILSLTSRVKRNFIYSLFFVSVFTLFFYLFFFDAPRRFQVRYIYIIIPYFIPLLSVGIYYFYKICRKLFYSNGKRYIFAFSVIILFIIFNPAKAFFYTLNESNGLLDNKNQIPHFDTQELTDFIKSNNIDVSKVLTTYPWYFNYYYDEPFLKNNAEKKVYTYFPWGFEYYDRTKIYSINGYWVEENVNIINNLIKSQDIDYLVFQATPLNKNYEQSYYYPLEIIENIKLIKIIDGDKSFGFYIYRVIN